MTDTLYLENLIKEKGLKKCYIAEKLGITRQALALKIQNKNVFSATEIKILCDLLGVTRLTEKEKIFFADRV